MMRYLSLFSGIEAASVAWQPLGWKCVGVAEIEPFPCAVLAHHYPGVPNLGNVSNITEEQIAALGRIDLIVGGFPCQDLSIAGKRKGLRNEDGSLTRSGLFFDAMGLVRVARARCGLRWLLVENVPGLYSSNGGRDFAALVGEIVGCGFDAPLDGWRNSGVAVGPRGQVEWATLDAQFFGLAQRRQRVFALGDFGDWRSRSPILPEPASLRGHPAPRREAGKGVAAPLTAGSPGGSGYRNDPDTSENLIARTLTANRAGGSGGQRYDSETETLLAVGVTIHGTDPTVQKVASYDELAQCLRARTPGNIDNSSTTVVQQPLAFDTTQCTSPANRSNPKPGDPCHPLAAEAHAPTVAMNFQLSQSGVRVNDTVGTLDANYGSRRHNGVLASAVRRLTPVECCRLQGFPDDYLDIQFRGKPAADGPRYRALGNSFAVPVVRWIGQRIAAEQARIDAGREEA